MLSKHSIRERLDDEDDAAEILDGFDKIVKRLRLSCQFASNFL